MHERRLSHRHKVDIPVFLHGPGKTPFGSTADVSRHGLFINTSTTRLVSELLQFWVQLPDQTFVKAMGLVVRTSADGSGVGIRLYMMDGRDKQEWDRYLDGLEAHLVGQVAIPEEVIPDEDALLPRFLLRPRSVAHLETLAAEELSLGGMFLRTPLPRRRGERVELLVIHPVTDRSFRLTAQVAVEWKEGAVAERGNGLVFEMDPARIRDRFQRFCAQEKAASTA